MGSMYSTLGESVAKITLKDVIEVYNYSNPARKLANTQEKSTCQANMEQEATELLRMVF